MEIKAKYLFACFFLLLFNYTLLAQEDSLHYRAAAQYNEQRYVESIHTLNLLLSYDKRDADTRVFMANCYLQQGKVNEAIDLAIKANKYQKGKGSLVLARAASAVDSFALAMSHLKELRKSRFSKYYHQLLVDPLLFCLTQLVNWENACNEGFFAPYEFTYQQILKALDAEMYGEALGWVRDVQADFPDEHYAWYLEALILKQMNQPENALKMLEKALDAYSAVAEYQGLKVQLCVDLGRADDGLSALRRYRHYAPFDAAALLWEAQLNQIAGDYDDAREALDFYSKLFPQKQEATLMQITLLKDSGKPLSALRMVNQLMRNDKVDAALYKLRGELYLETKSYEYAVKDFGMALDLTPRDASLWLKKGNARWLNGDAQGACNDWQWAKHYGSRDAIKKLLEHCP
jgi:tetratricopeptide (TPR) repeat protein